MGRMQLYGEEERAEESEPPAWSKETRIGLVRLRWHGVYAPTKTRTCTNRESRPHTPTTWIGLLRRVERVVERGEAFPEGLGGELGELRRRVRVSVCLGVCCAR